MATKRMLPHTVTIFTDIGEDERYHTQYSSVVYSHVYCQNITGNRFNHTPADAATVYMFDTATTNIDLFQPHPNGKDYLVMYDASHLTEPPPDALCINSVTRRQNGTRRMWHWRIDAR